MKSILLVCLVMSAALTGSYAALGADKNSGYLPGYPIVSDVPLFVSPETLKNNRVVHEGQSGDGVVADGFVMNAVTLDLQSLPVDMLNPSLRFITTEMSGRPWDLSKILAAAASGGGKLVAKVTYGLQVGRYADYTDHTCKGAIHETVFIRLPGADFDLQAGSVAYTLAPVPGNCL